MVERQGETSMTVWSRVVKRFFDFIFALVLLVVLSPVLVVVALLVKSTSRGPVFFTQVRGGRDGAAFLLVKFRTMRGGRKPDPKELVPLDHPEITPLGRFLRRSKLDELPQLFNVVRGEMSLVGPRPTLMDQVEAYDDFRRQRLLARPGISGLAQVYGNSMVSWDERILYDIAYVRRCSFLLDAGILMRTVFVVVCGEGGMASSFSESRFASVVAPPAGYFKA